jgi:hypothetical protein
VSADIDGILAEAVAVARTRLGGSAARARAIAIGWATVDLERAEAAFGLDFEDAPPDGLLGAKVRVAARDDGPALVLLEPDTEGLLAASLARLGEGPLAVWFEVGIDDGRLERAGSGPFGSERLIAGDPRHGRFVFTVGPIAPGTISG